MNRFQGWVLAIGGGLSLVLLLLFLMEVPWTIDATVPAAATALTLVLLTMTDENRTATAAGVVLLVVTLGFGSFGAFVLASKGWSWKAVGVGAWLLFAALVGVHKVLIAMGAGLVESAKSRRHQGLWKTLGYCLLLAGMGYLLVQTAVGFYKEDQLDRLEGIVARMKVQEEQIQSTMDRLEDRVSVSIAEEVLELIQSQLRLAEQGLRISEEILDDEKRTQRPIVEIVHYADLANKHSERWKELVKGKFNEPLSKLPEP